jgi:hypothetical protein
LVHNFPELLEWARCFRDEKVELYIRFFSLIAQMRRGSCLTDPLDSRRGDSATSEVSVTEPGVRRMGGSRILGCHGRRRAAIIKLAHWDICFFAAVQDKAGEAVECRGVAPLVGGCVSAEQNPWRKRDLSSGAKNG